MRNRDIREEAREARVKLWQVGEKLGMSDSAFSRYLRHELTDIQKTQIREIIRELSDEGRSITGRTAAGV